MEKTRAWGPEAGDLFRTGSAAIRARVRAGAFEAAHEIAAAERGRLRRHPRPPASMADAAAGLWAAIAEAELLSARVRAAADAALRALELGGADTASGRRAHALLAAASALNGEVALARRSVLLARRAGEDDACPALALAVCDGVVAASRSDMPALAAVSRTLAACPSTWGLACAEVFAGALAVAQGDTVTAVQRCSTVVSSVDGSRLPPLLRALAVNVLAVAYLLRGDTARTLSVVRAETEAATADHTLCVGGLAGAAWWERSDPLGALRATEECLRAGASHSLRTLPRVLLVRALAYRQLGDHRQARDAAADALALMAGWGGEAVSPALGLRAEDLRALLAEAFGEDAPDSVREFSVLLAGLPQPLERRNDPLPSLTPRVRVLARMLRGEETLGQIARRLSVSTNTVKSQLRQLYAQLEVSSRDEAVRRLELGGFYLADEADD